MADEQDKWLNRETAERLLRGEPLEAVDARARDQAERLSRALGALSAQAAPPTGELPGEQAALAAFRKAREAAEAERTAAALAEDAHGLPRSGADAGLIRIGAPARTARTGIPGRRPRRPRRVRLALAAGVSVGMLGGVAMAVGGGVLPRFGSEHPDPAASVSAGRTSGSPPTSASPSAPSSTGMPSRTPGGSGKAGGPDNGVGGGGSPGPGGSAGAPGGGPQDIAKACRELRDGKEPNSGRMRALENLAGGTSHVSGYCKVILAGGGSGGGTTNGDGGDGQGKRVGKGKGKGKGNGQGSGGDEGQGGDDGGHPGQGQGGDGNGNPGKGRHRVSGAPAAPGFGPQPPARTVGTTPAPSPSPTYTAS
ncbi:hypothetical protein ACH47Z_16285 [Streptomyces sp. NPDC020192]|uniref:hypothetical protein n=1 Tax=Streptomyces sp. NPDC020192 TaxID=3365066 RepID=UPI0037B32849